MENLIDRDPASLGLRSPEEKEALSVVLLALRERQKGDVEGFVATLDERVVYHDVPLPPAKGRGETRARAEAWHRAVPDLQIAVERVVVQGVAVVTMGRIRGTLRGDLFERPGTGQSFDLPFAQLALVWRGRIAYVRDHWDFATLMRQVGWAGE